MHTVQVLQGLEMTTLSNRSSYENNNKYSSFEVVSIAVGVSIMWILVVFGNMLVIIAIAKDKKINGVQNWFLASLAFADFLLGVLVMPFSLTNQLLGRWVFGSRWCDLWLAIDVLMCTSSIMNLCLISLDRYFSVSKPFTYPHQRTKRLASVMIAVVWLLSAIICLPPLLGWRKPQQDPNKCELTNDIGYVLYSTMGSFYIPMIIMIIVYFKIFQTALKQARKHGHKNAPCDSIAQCQHKESIKQNIIIKSNDKCLTVNVEDGDVDSLSKDGSSEKGENGSSNHSEGKEENGKTDIKMPTKEPNNPVQKALLRKKKVMKARERRATVVLGLIMGAFILCWLPFFTTYLINIFCRCVNGLIFDFFFWMGYCNSALNPVIYTVFNRDFRQAFKRILLCQKRSPGR